jgi:hypothetical protein
MRDPRTMLLQHYLATRYVVLDEAGPFPLTVGRHSGSLLRLQERHSVTCSAWLTAWNPASERRDDALNEAAQRELEDRVRAQGLGWLPGRAEDPLGRWPVEPSLWVPGLPADSACALARDFGQNALLLMGEEAVPRLVWVQSDGAPCE